MGASRARRNRVDRVQIVAVFTATGSLKAAGMASGVCASTARRVLVAEGLVDEVPRPRNKPAGQTPVPRTIGSGWSVRRAAREVGINARTGRDWRDGIRKGRNTRIHPDGTVVDYTTGSRYISVVTTTRGDGAAKPISDRYLSLQDRLAIADGRLSWSVADPDRRRHRQAPLDGVARDRCPQYRWAVSAVSRRSAGGVRWFV